MVKGAGSSDGADPPAPTQQQQAPASALSASLGSSTRRPPPLPRTPPPTLTPAERAAIAAAASSSDSPSATASSSPPSSQDTSEASSRTPSLDNGADGSTAQATVSPRSSSILTNMGVSADEYFATAAEVVDHEARQYTASSTSVASAGAITNAPSSAHLEAPATQTSSDDGKTASADTAAPVAAAVPTTTATSSESSSSSSSSQANSLTQLEDGANDTSPSHADDQQPATPTTPSALEHAQLRLARRVRSMSTPVQKDRATKLLTAKSIALADTTNTVSGTGDTTTPSTTSSAESALSFSVGEEDDAGAAASQASSSDAARQPSLVPSNNEAEDEVELEDLDEEGDEASEMSSDDDAIDVPMYDHCPHFHPLEVEGMVLEEVFPLSVQEFYCRYIRDPAFWSDVAVAAECTGMTLSDWVADTICCRSRVATFSVPVKHFLTSLGIGPKSTTVTQNQRVRFKNSSCFVFETSTVSHDVPHGEAFTLEARWKIWSEANEPGQRVTWVRIAWDVKFLTSVWIKGMIRSNALEGAQEFLLTWIKVAKDQLRHHVPPPESPLAATVSQQPSIPELAMTIDSSPQRQNQLPATPSLLVDAILSDSSAASTSSGAASGAIGSSGSNNNTGAAPIVWEAARPTDSLTPTAPRVGSRFSLRPPPPRPTSEVPSMPPPSVQQQQQQLESGDSGELGRRTLPNRRRRKSSGSNNRMGSNGSISRSSSPRVGDGTSSHELATSSPVRLLSPAYTPNSPLLETSANAASSTAGLASSSGTGAPGSGALSDPSAAGTDNATVVLHWVYSVAVVILLLFFIIPLVMELAQRTSTLEEQYLGHGVATTNRLHGRLDMVQLVLTRLSANITESASYLEPAAELSTRKQWLDYWAEFGHHGASKSPQQVLTAENISLELHKVGASALARGGYVGSWEQAMAQVWSWWYILSRLWTASIVFSIGVYSLHVMSRWLGFSP